MKHVRSLIAGRAVVRAFGNGAIALTTTMSAAQATVITVGQGAGYQYATLSVAVAAASAHDDIQIAAGIYTNDFVTINVPLTIEGIGGVAVLNATVQIPNGKAILVQNADLHISGLEFTGATVADNNGAGIRVQNGDLTVDNSIFQGDQDGILAGDNATTDILIRNSLFADNGFGDGFTHGIYANHIASLTVENSDFQGTKVGHDIKSRAAQTTITGDTLDDGVTGTTSYAIDLPNGGSAVISGNTITQGSKTENETMVSYGAEGNLYASNSLTVDGNTFVNALPGLSIGVFNHTAVVADLIDNTFTGVTDPLVGPGVISSSVPAPGALALLGLGLVGLRRRR